MTWQFCQDLTHQVAGIWEVAAALRQMRAHEREFRTLQRGMLDQPVQAIRGLSVVEAAEQRRCQLARA